jgi:hypothetical protein
VFLSVIETLPSQRLTRGDEPGHAGQENSWLQAFLLTSPHFQLGKYAPPTSESIKYVFYAFIPALPWETNHPLTECSHTSKTSFHLTPNLILSSSSLSVPLLVISPDPKFDTQAMPLKVLYVVLSVPKCESLYFPERQTYLVEKESQESSVLTEQNCIFSTEKQPLIFGL